MAAQKSRFTGLLLKAMHLGDAKSRGLRAAFTAEPDAIDKVAHLKRELDARWVELDKFFCLDTSASNIWEQRAKALIERELAVRSDSPNWWGRLTINLAARHIPGFSIKGANEKRHGAPHEWTLEQYAQLFADIEYVRKKYGGSVRKICEQILKKGIYRTRWGRYSPATLRKRFSRAVKLQKESTEFFLIVYGGDSLILAKGINRIDAAIQNHALVSK